MIGNSEKVRLIRVITQSEVVPWHLKNFIDRSQNDYELYIVGNQVSRYRDDYPGVIFIDNEIARKISPIKDLVALCKLITLFIRIRPHVVHSIMPKSGFLAALASWLTLTPVRVHTFTGQVWATKSGASRFILMMIDKIILKLNTRCLTDSPSQSEFLKENGFLKNGNKISYLGKGSLSGVSLSRFKLMEHEQKRIVRKELGLNEDDFVYIFLARKSVVKGINQLFASFDQISNLPRVKLLFIGPDESDGALSILNSKYKHLLSKIISLDIVKEHERYLAISDVLCLPSSSEGFGTIVIEASAMNVPSIGFDIVGLSDAIESNKTGILVPFPNVDKFADAMKDLYENEERLEQMRLNGRNRVLEYFSADAIYKFQKEFYKILLDDKLKH